MRLLWCWGIEPPELFGSLHADGIEVVSFTGTQTDLARTLADGGFQAVLVRRGLYIDRSVLAAAPTLKFVQRAGRTTRSIDTQACQDCGVAVAATAMHIDVAVAEHALALMLALRRQLIRADQDVRAATYRELALTPEPTTESRFSTNWTQLAALPTLYRRRLGIVGLGEIGTALAERARAFGMDIVYHQRHQADAATERRLDAKFVDLAELAEMADVVSLHVPHTESTEGLVDADFLRRMRPSSILINVSRGALVDEEALVCALRDRRIAGAGLDVFEREPLGEDSPLISAPNTILTPHIASGTDIALDVARLQANLLAYRHGETVRDLVVPAAVDR
jgi:D-3-phosphoglycerate dehydrogenase